MEAQWWTDAPTLLPPTDPPVEYACGYNGTGPEPIGWATAVGWCVYSSLEVASRFLGFASILFWLFAQFPQIWENYKLKSAQALSAGFLLLWTLGDSSYLISVAIRISYGGVLATQLYQAAYFCTIDVLLWSQFIYYNYVYNRIHLQLPPSTTSINSLASGAGDGEESQQLLGSKTRTFVLAGAMMTVLHVALPAMGVQSASAVSVGRSLLQADTNEGINPDTVGVVFAWICAALYLGSRVPQIFLNGLSISLFLFAVMGNITQVMSIVLYSIEPDYLIGQLPYLLGSGGTLIFDAIIFVQFWKYRYSQPKELRDFGEYSSQDIKL